MTAPRAVDPTHRTFVSYIDKSREYYAALGYQNPYRWAYFDDVPFSRLRRPLAQAAITLVTTAHEGAEAPSFRTAYSLPSDNPDMHLSTDGLFWDRQATHTDDLDSYFPVQRLREFVRDGRLGRLAPRLHGVPTEYSQRRTIERDAPEILRRCQQDGVDAALLTPL
jgi:D-proline reductase (dithiol) PrdB